MMPAIRLFMVDEAVSFVVAALVHTYSGQLPQATSSIRHREKHEAFIYRSDLGRGLVNDSHAFNALVAITSATMAMERYRYLIKHPPQST